MTKFTNLRALLLLCLASGAGMAQTTAPPDANPVNPFAALGALLSGRPLANTSTLAVSPNNGTGSASRAGTMGKANNQERAIALLRSPEDMQSLFSQKTVSARSILLELSVIRKGAAQQNLNAAMGAFFGAPTAGAAAAAPQAAASNFLGRLFSGDVSGLLSPALDAALDLLITDFAYQKLDDFFNTMAERGDVLDKVTVDLPQVANSNPQMRQTVLGMAALIGALKASSMIMEGNDKILDEIKESQKRVMDTRRSATRVLAEALLQTTQLDERGKIAQLNPDVALADDEKAFLERFKDKPVAELLRDFGAQNVALSYLKSKDPAAWDSYQLELVKLKTRQSQYVKTLAGVSSAAGFAGMFFKRAKTTLESSGVEGVSAVLPLTIEGVKESVSIGRRAFTGLLSNDEPLDGTFFVRNKQGEVVKRGLTASRALATVGPEDLNAFVGSLIRDDSEGAYKKVYQRLPRAMAETADRLTSKDTKRKYALDRLQIEDSTDFSFQNVLAPTAQATGNKASQLAPEIFSQLMPATTTSPEDLAVVAVQKDMLSNSSKLINRDIRMLMFSQPPAGTGRLEPEIVVGSYFIGIDSPGAQGLADYDDWLIAEATRASEAKAAQAAATAATAAAAERPKNAKTPAAAKSTDVKKKK